MDVHPYHVMNWGTPKGPTTNSSSLAGMRITVVRVDAREGRRRGWRKRRRGEWGGGGVEAHHFDGAGGASEEAHGALVLLLGDGPADGLSQPTDATVADVDCSRGGKHAGLAGVKAAVDPSKVSVAHLRQLLTRCQRPVCA